MGNRSAAVKKAWETRKRAGFARQYGSNARRVGAISLLSSRMRHAGMAAAARGGSYASGARAALSPGTRRGLAAAIRTQRSFMKSLARFNRGE